MRLNADLTSQVQLIAVGGANYQPIAVFSTQNLEILDQVFEIAIVR